MSKLSYLIIIDRLLEQYRLQDVEKGCVTPGHELPLAMFYHIIFPFGN